MTCKEKIFISCFNLKFYDKEIENNFQEDKNRHIKSKVSLISGILLLFSIAGNIILSNGWKNKPNDKYYSSMCIFSFTLSGVLLIIFICSLLKLHTSQNKIINYLNFFLYSYVLINLRFPITQYTGGDQFAFYLLITLDMILRLLWILSGQLEFLECLIISTIHSILVWMWAALLADSSTLTLVMLKTLTNDVSIIITVVLSYLYDVQSKKRFYYTHMAEKKSEKLLNILENMNTGFLSLKGGKIDYINTFLLNKLQKLQNFNSINDLQQTEKNCIST
jgi:hypothetical protein